MSTTAMKKTMTAQFQRRHRRSRGAAAVLAMLYMVLFSVLAIGFYASVNTSVQIAGNEQRIDRARLAAESGMAFMRCHLYNLDISHYTPVDQLFDTVYATLQARLNPTLNFSGKPIGRVGDTIYIPAQTSANPTYIDVDDPYGQGQGFRATITRSGKQLIVQVAGRYGGSEVARAIQLTYDIYEKPSAVFDFGVASKSNITMIGNTSIIGAPDPKSGSVLSTSSAAFPLSMGNTCRISGEVAFSNPNAWVDAKGGSIINNEVGEAHWQDNVHIVPEPEFPIVDSGDYASYATTVISTNNPSGTEFSNIRIRAGANPTFSGNVNITGVVYVEAPNQIVFSGNCNITGVIVVETKPPGEWTPAMGDWTTNSIDFRGTVNAAGVENLPAEPKYAGLQDLKGAMILADNFAVKFGGTSTSGTTTQIAGSIVASAVEFYGTADATVDGSIINLADSAVNFQGKAAVTIKTRGNSDKPHGLYFGSRYEPLPGSYREIKPL